MRGLGNLSLAPNLCTDAAFGACEWEVEMLNESEYYRDDKPQIYGKGFKNMQAKMLPGEYQTFMYRLQGKFGRNPYFERRKGARLCSSKEMKEVEAVLKAINHEELKFDAYVEKLNWDD